MKTAEVEVLERARRLRETLQREGARAYLAGVPLEECPHLLWWRRSEWEAGWHDANFASKEE
jgi:ribosome modulation factor